MKDRRPASPEKRPKRHSSRAPEARPLRFRTLARLNQLISFSLDDDQLLRAIAKAAAELMGAPVVSIWMVDEAVETLTLAAFSDQHLAKGFPVATLGFDRGGVGWVARHRQALDVPDVHADGRLLALGWASAHKRRSFFAVPVISGDSLLAVLAMNGRKPFLFSPEDRDLLDMFVAQAGAAIRNARLFSLERATGRQLETLAEIQREIVSKLDRARLLDIIVSRATRFFEADGAIQLVEPDGSVAPGAWSEIWDLHDVRIPSGEGVVGWSVETRQGIVVNDYATWPRAASRFVELGMTRAWRIR